MESILLDLSTNKLLSKFGAGEHKPGSGSAAALQGMLSAELICTVISLTLAPKRVDSYKAHSEEIATALSDIRDRISPRLQHLFQEDSSQFDKAIKLRKKRDNTKNIDAKKKLAAEARQALVPATEIPLEIATLCENLAEYAELIFNAGFKSARGDSGVALSGAVSAIGGCLSIIDLNLLSFPPDKWAEDIYQQTESLRAAYDELTAKVVTCLNSLRIEVEANTKYHQQTEIFKDKKSAGAISSDEDIERLVRQLQNLIWTHRDKIWKKNVPTKHIDILDPEKAIRIIGYDISRINTLGQYTEGGETFEVAGHIDNKSKNISISEQFSSETQLFTAAHELGHAIMHKQNVLHRDRAIDGSSSNATRSRVELQADKFAAYFLMPRNQIIKTFSSLFLTHQFVMNDLTAFALISKSLNDLKSECKDLRALSRKLASTEYYNSNRFTSIAKQYRVSVEAMAIRLEELNLLIYP